MTTACRIAALAATAALTVARPFAQTAPQKPSFEVISIKPSAPVGAGPVRIGGGAQGDRFTMNGATLRMLLQTAYRPGGDTPLPQVQIVGGPGWMDSDRYDVQAKADCSGGTIPREQLQLMVQSLLEERFQLKAHLETRELPVYDLVVGKDGPKIKRSADQTPAARPVAPPGPCDPASSAAALPFPGGRGGRGGRDGRPFEPGSPAPRGSAYMMMSANGMTVRATAMPLRIMLGLLQQQLGRRIVDKTGLDGLYDFEMTFSSEGLESPFGRGFPMPPPVAGAPAGAASAGPTASDPVPSLFTAIQELGLKLESTRGPVEVLVIDAVEKPTEN
jgi:uncharacterized protein (TIGR03435 family)